MMITRKQFIEGIAVLRNAFGNVTVQQMETWYPYFQQWEPQIFRQTISQAALSIDYLTVKSLYDLARKIWEERESLALRTVSSLGVGVDEYWEKVEALMEGWSYPSEQSAANNYPADDPLRLMIEEQQRALETAIKRPELTEA